jgi:hypothetical protein
LFTAVHKCWKPPPLAQAHTGVQITVQFSITRDGRLQGKAAVRYESPDASDHERLAYRRSVAESLAPCVAFPITDGLGNAVAGRPLNVRFIDTHKQREADRQIGTKSIQADAERSDRPSYGYHVRIVSSFAVY